MNEDLGRVLDESRGLVELVAEAREQMARRAGLTRASWRVLTATVGEGRTVPQLARRLGVQRQSVQRLADQLVESGRAQYASNPDHRRSPFLTLTESGNAALRALERELSDWEADLNADVETEELETTLYVLRSLRALIRV